MTSLILYFAIFLFGSIIGSFLNVVIFRTAKGTSFVKGRSMCPACHHKLGVHDLMPIVSFIVLRGKCRYCTKAIAWQYIIVEIITGALFVASFLWITHNTVVITPSTLISLLIWWWTIALCVVLFVSDVRFYKLPNAATYPGIIGACILILLIAGITESGFLVVLLPRLLALLIFGLIFIAIFYISNGKWMGGGDVKFIIFMSIVLGFPEALIALLIACISGAAIGSILLLSKKRTLKTKIPFGAFLTTGTLVALFFSAKIIEWYQQLF